MDGFFCTHWRSRRVMVSAITCINRIGSEEYAMCARPRKTLLSGRTPPGLCTIPPTQLIEPVQHDNQVARGLGPLQHYKLAVARDVVLGMELQAGKVSTEQVGPPLQPRSAGQPESSLMECRGKEVLKNTGPPRNR